LVHEYRHTITPAIHEKVAWTTDTNLEKKTKTKIEIGIFYKFLQTPKKTNRISKNYAIDLRVTRAYQVIGINLKLFGIC
jgi:hypothetical protein